MPRATTGLSYLTLGLVLLGSVIFIVFVILPQWTAYKEAQQHVATALATKQEKEQFLQDINARVQELNAHAKDAQVLNLALPKEENAANVFAELQRISGTSGSTIVEIGPSKEVIDSSQIRPDAQGTTPAAKNIKTKKLETTVKVSGTYPQIRALLDKIESSVILSDVVSLRLNAANLTSSSASPSPTSASLAGILQGDVTVRTYIQPYTTQ